MMVHIFTAAIMKLAFVLICAQLHTSNCNENILAADIHKQNTNDLKQICLASGITEIECNCQSIPNEIKRIRRNLCNNTSTGEQSVQNRKNEKSSKIYGLLVLAIAVTGFVLNLMILMSYFYKKEVRNYQYIITQLAFYHMTFSLFLSTVFFYSIWVGIKIHGECKIAYFVVLVGIHLPISFILPLMLDRFVSICYTFDIFNRWRIKVFILLHMLTSIVIKLPLMDKKSCCVDLTGNSVGLDFNILVFLYQIVLPTLLITILYFKARNTLNDQIRVQSCFDRYTVRSMRIIGNKRILKIIKTMLCNFVICIFPSLVLFFIDADRRFPYKLCLILSLMFLVTNPLVYMKLDRPYRRDMKLLMQKIRTGVLYLWLKKYFDKINEIFYLTKNGDRAGLLTPGRMLDKINDYSFNVTKVSKRLQDI